MEVGSVNPEGSRLLGIPPIAESRELRSPPPGSPPLGRPDGGMEVAMVSPEGSRLDGIPPITESRELSSAAPPGNPPPGTLTLDERLPGTLAPDGSAPGTDVMPDGRTPDGTLPGRVTDGRPLPDGKPPGRLTDRLPDGSTPGRPLDAEPAIGDASQALIAFGPPPACVGSPELGVVHRDSLGSPATVAGGVLPQ
jgi:hypothetical protein